MASRLPYDAKGNPVQVFSPDEILLDQTTIDVSDKTWIALLPADPCKIKIDGTTSFVTWPYGCALGLSDVQTITFEAATDVYVMR